MGYQQPQPTYGQPQPTYAQPQPAPMQPQPVMMYPAQPAFQPPPKRSSLPTIAGVFLILGAIAAIAIGGLVLAAVSMILGTVPMQGTPEYDAYNKAMTSIGVCGGMYIVAFVFGLLAAIFCFKRQKWMLTFIFTLLAMIFPLIGPFSFVFAFGGAAAGLSAGTAIAGWLLGGGVMFLIGLLLVLISKKHFEEPPKMPPAQPMAPVPMAPAQPAPAPMPQPAPVAPAPAPAPAPVANACPTCHQPMQFIEQYHRYYCNTCQKYA